MKTFLIFVSLVILVPRSNAEFRFASVFGDHAVLQRDQSVPIWGWASPNSSVKVQFGGQQKAAHCNEEGKWMVMLDAMPASAKSRDLTAAHDGNQIVLHDILVGEVWLAAGQSNMNHTGPDRDVGIYPFHRSPDDKNLPEIRVRRFGAGASDHPYSDLPKPLQAGTAWETLTIEPEQGANMAAYFARVLRDTLKVPVGILHVAVSGTNQTAWMSKETLESFPPHGDNGSNAYESFFADREKKLISTGKFSSFKDFQHAEQQWMENISGQWPGRRLLEIKQFPSVLYNSRVHPAAPYGLRGVIWHQGEAGPREGYAERLVAMFENWRELFGQNLYVIWGTLSRDSRTQPPLVPARGGFYRSATNVELRKAIDLFKGDERADYVELYDLGNYDTHFSMKAEGGRRYGLSALRMAYGMKAPLPSGPRLVNWASKQGEILLKFDLAGKGLAYRPGIAGISGFYVYGDGSPAWGQVEILNKQVLRITHPEGKPVEWLGYGDSPNPHETLFNSDGLPASPFTLTVNDTRPQDAKPSLVLVKSGDANVQVVISHLRRYGYRFTLRSRKDRGSETTNVRLWIPNEWQEPVVESGGKKVTTTPVEHDGEQYLTANIPFNQDIVVADRKALPSIQKAERF